MNINDRELLARTLQAEAGNQGYDGMLAAGSVIMNRANATGYGDGMRGVILKPGQFSAWNSRKGPDGNPIYADGEQGQDMAAMRASDGAYRAADALIAGTYEDATGGATHYYNPDYSQPKWGQKAGGDWKRIGDHVFGFADAGKKPNPNQAIASDTMKALGSLPNAVGLLGSAQAANNTESKMIPEEKPRGLLGSLGIQKMEEGAEGEAGQRFFQRDTFKDTAAQLAQGFAAMGSNPALQKMTADVASQRTESKAKNKTIEYLRANGRGDLADAVDSGSLGIRDAAGIMFAQPKDGSTAAKKNYDAYQKILAEEGPEAAKQFLSMSRSGSTTNVNMPKQMGTITPGWKADYDNDGNVTSMSVIPGGPAAQEIEAQRVKAETQDNTGSIMGRNVVQTASRVRDLISPYSVGYGSLLSALPESAARELKGEVDVLGAIASSENLNAMRLASPTGGALGNVSDSDIKLLKDKSGAIDIGSSPSTFRRQVDEYELFLLQVIHGPEAGQYMFDNSRPAPVSPAVTDGEPKSKETIRDDAMRKWLKDNKRGAD